MARMTGDSGVGSNTNSPKEIQLYTLYDVAREIKTSIYTLQDWIDDKETVTPPASFRVGSQFYWTEDTIPAWKVLVDKEVEKLAAMTWNKDQLVDLLIVKAKDVERRAKRAYPRGRGEYSMQGARLKVIELEGIISFIRNLGQQGFVSDEKSKEIFSALRNAKQQLDMK